MARRQAPLEELAADLASIGATAHVITADLSDADAVPQLAGQIRGVVGDPGALYYGVSAGGFIPVAALTPERARALMPLALYSLLALVQEFLPAMLERGDGAILSAQGASAVRGMPFGHQEHEQETTPNGARAVPVPVLRSPARREAKADDHVSGLKVTLGRPLTIVAPDPPDPGDSTSDRREIGRNALIRRRCAR